MQLYRAELRCKEPVGLGFSCDEPDTQVFTYAGEPLTISRIEKTINEVGVKCWKCFSRAWRIKEVVPISYRSKMSITRT